VRVLLLAASLLAVTAASASAAPITEFTTGLGAAPGSLTAGPDGNLWFVDTGAIGRITPAGQITEFKTGLIAGSMPHAIVAGTDGNLWFTDSGTTKAVGKITPTGQITEPISGLNPGAAPYELTAGANDTLWFTDPGTTKAIGRIIPATGAIKEFAYTTDPLPNMDAITGGPDGSVYFTDKGNVPGVGKVTPDGTITEATTPVGSMPSGIGGGPDGNVWFTDQGSTTAIVTEFSTGLQPGTQPDAIIGGPDGNVWFDDQYNTHPAIGQITPSGQITEFPTGGKPADLVFGIDGNLWVPEYGTPGVQRITPTGSMTTFTNGLGPGTDLLETNITVGPDGNLWFIDKGTPKAIARADVQLPPSATTGSASSLTTSSATVAGTVDPLGAATTVTFQYGTTPALGSTAPAGSLKAGPDPATVAAALTGLPAGATIYYRVVATNTYGTTPGAIRTFTTVAVTTPRPPKGPTTRTTIATVGNQRLTLVTPATTACAAKNKRLSLTLSASTIAHSRAAKLRFVSAGVYLDRGVKHVRTVRSHGKRHRVTVYRANAIAHKLPARLSLPITSLRSGQHTVNVRLLFEKRRNVPVRKTLKVRFRVC
jgi:streptogramin lyase